MDVLVRLRCRGMGRQFRLGRQPHTKLRLLAEGQNLCRTSDANSTHRYALPGRVTRTYLTWQRAKDRCLNPDNKRYADYGGRGVSICPRWRDDFAAFLQDMGDAPDGMSLDRWPDTHGNYEPGNCRWATPQMQSENRRNTVWVEHNGERLSLKSYAARRGVSYKALFNRVRYRGQDPRAAADAMLQ